MLLRNLLFLIVLGGCATRYTVPTNRFITPESQGGTFHGQFEFQQTQAQQATVVTDNGSVTDGVTYQSVKKPGYMASMSLYDPFDFIWTHVNTGNSLGGAKLQLLGASRTAKGTGHKLSAVVLFGGNEHETADKSVKFRLDGQELMVVYGFRVSEFVLPYVSLSQSTYKFQGTLTSSDPSLNGAEPDYTTKALALNMGGDFSYGSFFLKVEYSYQKLDTSHTEKKNIATLGFSAGLGW